MTGGKRTYFDRLSAVPGIHQAFGVIMRAALMASREEYGEIDEEKFYDLKLKMARKVAELWELSPMMEQYLIQSWVEAKTKLRVELREKDLHYLEVGFSSDRAKATGQDLELEILFTGKEVLKSSEVNSQLERSEARVITEDQTRKNHLYLDVTGLSYKDLRNAYPAITRCRKMLGLEVRDVRRGAPASVDSTRALLAAYSEATGLSRKEVAEMLEFKIYTEDVPSGTYPLFQKYLKVGRVIKRRLYKLREYVHELTGMEQGTV